MSKPAKAHQVWRADSRGHLTTGWLDARLTLNFGGWRLPGRERFGPLRVLNDDRVLPSQGFGMHSHRDLEILMVPLTTAIEHRDSEGRHQWVRPGQIQWMRAGHGIAHSQMNASTQFMDRHLQLWVEPQRRGLAPEVQVHEVGFPPTGRWQPLCGGAAGLFQPDAVIDLQLGRASAGAALPLPTTGARLLQVVQGDVDIVGGSGLRETLREGDALVFHRNACALLMRGATEALLLCVDLPEPLR